jgi:hypothetical protein
MLPYPRCEGGSKQPSGGAANDGRPQPLPSSPAWPAPSPGPLSSPRPSRWPSRAARKLLSGQRREPPSLPRWADVLVGGAFGAEASTARYSSRSRCVDPVPLRREQPSLTSIPGPCSGSGITRTRTIRPTFGSWRSPMWASSTRSVTALSDCGRLVPRILCGLLTKTPQSSRWEHGADLRVHGGAGRTRTCDRRIMSPLL